MPDRPRRPRLPGRRELGLPAVAGLCAAAVVALAAGVLLLHSRSGSPAAVVPKSVAASARPAQTIVPLPTPLPATPASAAAPPRRSTPNPPASLRPTAHALPPSAVPGSAIRAFAAPTRVPCGAAGAVTAHVTWQTANAAAVAVAVDGVDYRVYTPAGAADLPFDCAAGVTAHTYTLRTVGGFGVPASRSVTVRRA